VSQAKTSEQRCERRGARWWGDFLRAESELNCLMGQKDGGGGGGGGKVREGEQKHVQDVECTVATASQFKNKDRKG